MDQSSYVLRVVGVEEETADAHSVSFAVPEGAELEFDYSPGQFLTLAVPSERTGAAARCYSLSSSPHEGGPLTVTVKRTADGYASNWICDNLREGSTIRALKPSGIFTPADLDADLLLFAGGSGITPMMSIVRMTLARGRGKIVMFYANRDERSVIFASELAALSAEHPHRLVIGHWLESVQGRPTQEQMETFVRPFATHDAFVCGPPHFMKLAGEALRELGFPRERRHQEKFVSLSGNPFDEPVEQPEIEVVMPKIVEMGDSTAAPLRGVTLERELDGETHTFDNWDRNTKMLEHLESKGLKPPYSCREGQCSTCAVRLIEGEVTMLNNEVLDDEDMDDGIRLACQSLPITDTIRATYD